MAGIESPWKVFVMGIGFMFIVVSGVVEAPGWGTNYPMIVGGLVIVVASAISIFRGRRR